MKNLLFLVPLKQQSTRCNVVTSRLRRKWIDAFGNRMHYGRCLHSHVEILLLIVPLDVEGAEG